MFLILISSASLANSEGCESLIALSRIIGKETSNKSKLEKNTKDFCEEYKNFHENSKTNNFGASYKFLSASFGSSGASVDTVAKKYCSNESNDKESSDEYEKYIDLIAPGAYGAYEKCIGMKGLEFKIDEKFDISPKEFTMTTSFSTDDYHVQSVDVEANTNPSYGSKCFWTKTNSHEISIPSGKTAILKCSRENQSEDYSVKIVATTKSNSSNNQITIPWKKYISESGINDTQWVHADKEVLSDNIDHPYTTGPEPKNGGDDRIHKKATCPSGKIIVPETPRCINTALKNPIYKKQISNDIYMCEWEPQNQGTGIGIEMACRSPN
jgi:hypothetical protein